MGKFKLKKSNGETLWVKNIDKVNETLEFTTNEYEAYDRDGDFYTRGEISSLKNPLLYDQEKAIKEFYDLSGRQMPTVPTEPGLYIHDGKKVFVK